MNFLPSMTKVIFGNVLTDEQGTLHKSEAVSIFASGIFPYTASAISLETIIKVVPVLDMLIKNVAVFITETISLTGVNNG
jgi:hypothetical protein